VAVGGYTWVSESGPESGCPANGACRIDSNEGCQGPGDVGRIGQGTRCIVIDD
jgi:hypothetical protein